MIAKTILALGALSVASAQTIQPAAVIKDNVPGTSYVATLEPKDGAEFPLSGTVTGTASADGTGVDWSVSVNGFDTSKGPFAYHIHAFPVDSTGNCSSTKAHLDPTVRGEATPCDAANPATCQVGDLAGKHGKVKSDSFSASYSDKYLSTTPGNPHFFGNLSVVFHLPDKTRIGCANFKLVQKGGEGASSTGYIPYPTGGAPPFPTGTGASSGFATATGTGAGPYPTGTDAPVIPSGSGSAGVPPNPSASSSVPGGATDTPQAGAAGKIGVAGAVVAAGFAALLL